MSQRRSPHPEAGLGQLGGALMMATHAGQNVQRNLSRPRYAPAPKPQPKPQPQAQKQARPQAQPQPYYQEGKINNQKPISTVFKICQLTQKAGCQFVSILSLRLIYQYFVHYSHSKK
jgi:hypothetical protein